MAEPVLCYVRRDKAFFTTQELSKQVGDDWNDVPYEHNAGEPYTPHREGDDWEITAVYFETELVTPDYCTANSNWSVDQINAGVVAWLRDWPTGTRCIHAGTTLGEFKRKIKEWGGRVFVEEA